MRTQTVRSLAPRSRGRNRLAPRVDRLEDRRLMAVAIAESALPVATSATLPMTVTGDGAIWSIGVDSATGFHMQRTDAQGKTTVIPDLPAGEVPTSLFAAGNDSVWATTEGGTTSAGHLVKFTPIFSVSTTLPAGAVGGTIGPDGNVWMTLHNFQDPTAAQRDSVAEYDVKAGKLSVVPTSPGVTVNSSESAIVSGSDGNLWFLDGDMHLVKMTTSGATTEYYTGIVTPTGLAAETDGHVWVGGSTYGTSKLESFTTDGTMTPLSLGVATQEQDGSIASPRGIAAAADGSMWFIKGDRLLGHTWGGGETQFFPIFPAGSGVNTIFPDGGKGFYVPEPQGPGNIPGAAAKLAHITTDAPDPGVYTVAATFGRASGPLPAGVTIATFTTTDASEFSFNFDARYQIDGGPIREGTVLADGHGGYVVQTGGIDGIQSPGTHSIGVNIIDLKHGESIGAHAGSAGLEIVGSGQLAVTPAPMEFRAGLPSNGVIATLHNPTATDNTPYSGIIDWGDGTTSSVSAEFNGGTAYAPSHDFNLWGTHTYATAGTYSVHLYEAAPSTGGDAAWKVNVGAVPVLSLQPVPIVAGVGEHGVYPVATFSTPYADLAIGNVVATIDWGDGTPATGNYPYYDYSASSQNDLGFVVHGEHSYATAGTWTVHVTLSFGPGQTPLASMTETATSVAHDFPLVPSINYRLSGGAYVVDSVYQPGDTVYPITPHAHTGRAGTPNGEIALATSGSSSGSPASFSYGFSIPGGAGQLDQTSGSLGRQDGSISLMGFTDANGHDPFPNSGFVVVEATVSMNQMSGGPTETVYNVVSVHGPRNLVAQSPTVASGSDAKVLLAKFDAFDPSDVASNYAVTGTTTFTTDGNFPAGSAPTIAADPAGGFDVWSVLSPAKAGNFSLAITQSRHGNVIGQQAVSGSISLTSPSIENLTPATGGFSQGTAARAKVATFTSGSPGAVASNFSATFGLPGGSPFPAEITANAAGGFDVWASIYSAGWGVYPLTVSVKLVGDDSARTVESDALVTPAPITATTYFGGSSSLDADANAPFSTPVATFSSFNPNASVSDFAATIAWGDGTTTAGIIRSDATFGFMVGGSHTYATTGRGTLTVTITDLGANGTSTIGAVVSGATSISAEPEIVIPPPSYELQASTDLKGFQGSIISGVVATINDPISGSPSQYAATVDWGDGSTSKGQISNYGNGFVVYASHTYGLPGYHAFGVIVQKTGETPSTTSGLIAVAQPAPIGVPASGGAVGGGVGTVTVPPTPMKIVSARSIRGKKNTLRVVVTLSGTINAATASNRSSFTLTDPGKDGKFGTKDDKIVAINASTFDATSNTLTLVPKGTFRRPIGFRVALMGGAGVTAMTS